MPGLCTAQLAEPRTPAEHAQFVADRLLEIEIIAIFGAPLAGEHDRIGRIEFRIEQREIDRLTVASGKVSIRPQPHAKFSVTREQGIARLELGDIRPARKQACVELVRVRLDPGEEIADAQCPMFLVELGDRAVTEPDLVRWVIEGARRPDRPIHEIGTRIHRVGVVVKHVVHREASDLNGNCPYALSSLSCSPPSPNVCRRKRREVL